MAPYDPTTWREFFIAVAGASSALAGLLFVAVSVNVKQILAGSALPSRAYSTIGTLILLVLISIAGLIPEQSVAAFGIEILAFSAGASALLIRWIYLEVHLTPRRPPREEFLGVSLAVVQMAVFGVGGVTTILGVGGGLYWIAAGVLIVFFGATINSWVLLVEILR